MKYEARQISVSLPDSLRRQIRKIAREEKRSFSSQVAFFLEQAVSRMDTTEQAVSRLDADGK